MLLFEKVKQQAEDGRFFSALVNVAVSGTSAGLGVHSCGRVKVEER